MSCLSRRTSNVVTICIQTRSSCTRSSVSGISNQTSELERRARALRVLAIVSSKPVGAPNRPHRLIQDSVRMDSTRLRGQAHSDDFDLSKSRYGIPSLLSEILQEEEEEVSSRSDNGGDLSYAVRSCGSNRDYRTGLGLHNCAVKTGLISNVYVGSSLIAFYVKCRDLEHAYKVFEEMSDKNVVSWTAIISGFAAEWRVDICLKLYSKMRNSISKPNDFTFTTLLSACTNCGALGQGRTVHSQTIQMGFISCVHISNTLISMYSKCGSLEDAFCIFNQMSDRDIVSWNSMIAGYAQHGLAAQAIGLFEEMMAENGMKPDGITYLGVLSSCRHAGFVKEGRNYFGLMSRHGVEPELDHYSCLIDLLGRFGLLQEALDLIGKMPMKPNAVIWGSVLASCRVHGDVWIGIRAAEERLVLEPGCAGTHVQLANLYASVGFWKEAGEVRKMMKNKGLRTNPGCSWIEIKNQVCRFRPEDRSNNRVANIVHVLDHLFHHMTCFHNDDTVYS